MFPYQYLNCYLWSIYYLFGCHGNCISQSYLGDPVTVSLERQREWDETVRLHFYNQEKELLMHGKYTVSKCTVSIQ